MKAVVNRLPWTARLIGLTIVILLASYRSDSRPLAGEPCRVTGNEAIRVAYPRYVPSDPVRISGEGFAPSCDVTVVVTRPDGSAAAADGDIPGSGSVATDEDGTFSLVYNQTELRGTYSVQAQGAAASFTSGPYVQTDAEDYHPGATVTVTGAGWQPGEPVTLWFREVPDIHPDTTIVARADARGTLFNNEFRPGKDDGGVRFFLEASGSGDFAEASFNDGPPAAGDYRSHQGGDWGDPSTWERFDGTSWITPAPSTPGCASPCAPSAASVEIQATHEVFVVSDITVDSVTVDLDGQLTVTPVATVTLANGLPNPDMTVNGALLVMSGGVLALSNSSGTFPNAELVVNGSATVDGGLAVGNRASATVNGTMSAAGTVQIGGGGATTKGSLTVAPSGSFTLGGTGLSALGSLALQGVAVISGAWTSSNNSDITISSTGNVTVSGSMNLGSGSSSSWTVNGALTYTGIGNSNLTGASSTANPMTVNSSGIVSLGPSSVISSSTGGPFTLNSGGQLRIGSAGGISLTGSTGNIRTAGTRTFNAGAFYTYNGTSAQNTGAGLPASVAKLTISNPSGVSVVPAADKTVTTALSLTAGPLVSGLNKIIVASTGSVSSSGGWVSGNLQEFVPAGSSVMRFFPIGTGTAANPVSLTFATVSTAGNAIARATSGDNGSIGSSTLNASKSVNDSWTLTNSGVVFSSFDAVFGFNAGDLDAGADPNKFGVGQFAGGSWSYPVVSGRTPTSTGAAGMTTLAGSFAVAEPADSTPPETSITSGPANPTNSVSATFSFSGTDDQTPAGSLTFHCRLDGGPAAPCTSPAAYPGPFSEGSHTFSVFATDLVGNSDASPATHSWTVDTTPPDTMLSGQPSNPTNSSSATFQFSSTEAASTFECQLDGGGFSPCTSSKTYASLAAGGHAFQVKATDPAGNTDPSAASYSWTVNGPPSSVIISAAPGTLDEGDTATLNGSFSDPGDTGSHVVTIGWGDGSADTVLTLPGGTFGFSAAHSYTDDNPTGTAQDTTPISVIVTDGGGLSGSAATSVVVRNKPPVVTGVTGPLAPIPAGGSATLSAAFTDAGVADTHTCVFTWNDVPVSTSSAGAVTESGGSGSCSATHAYGAAGVYLVSVAVTDDDGGSATGFFRYVVIFDADGGFTTGGGWIASPAGGLTADPAASGKANYGFNAKYVGDKTVPNGSLEFHLQSGGLNFKSVSYDWLVISGGYKAQAKGHGSINNSGNYGFLLTVIDGSQPGSGGTNRFRLKISDEANGNAVIYDSEPGVSDTADPATVPGGGTIAVHK